MKIFSPSRFAISRLPAIPVIVLGLVLALLLMLGWSHQNSRQAEAQEPPPPPPPAVPAGIAPAPPGPGPGGDGILNVTFEAKPPLDSALMEGLCVDIGDGIGQALKFKVCDGGPQDNNPAPGEIRVSLTIDNPFLLQTGLYSIEAQTVKDSVNGFGLDPTQQPGNGDAKRECDLLASLSIPPVCDITFSYSQQIPIPVGGISVDLGQGQGGLPLDVADRSGGNAGLLAALIAGISAAAIAVTGAAWYARRRSVN